MDSQESQPGKQQHQAQNPLQFQQSLQQQHHQPPPLTVAPPHHPPQQQQQQPQQPISYNFASNVQAHHNNSFVSGSSVMPIQQPQQQNPRFPFSSTVNDTVSSAPIPNLDGSSSMATGSGIEPARRKRGRPRKYSPGANTARGLSPTPVTPISSVAPQTESGGAGTATGTASSENPSKKSRGRPPSSGKKQLDALGATGVGFIPHVLTVDVGEDIVSKIMAFSQQGPRTVCILSANGAVRDVTLRQPAHSAGILTFKGRHEIISLSGSISLSESSGSQSKTSGGLSATLAGPDGSILGGGVAGKLIADTPVQLVVGSFIGEGKKPVATAPPSTPSSNMLNLGAAPPSGATPFSQGDSSSDDSSDEDGGSPHSHGPGPYAANAPQPIQSVPMYGNMGWPNDNTKTPP